MPGMLIATLVGCLECSSNGFLLPSEAEVRADEVSESDAPAAPEAKDPGSARETPWYVATGSVGLFANVVLLEVGVMGQWPDRSASRLVASSVACRATPSAESWPGSESGPRRCDP